MELSERKEMILSAVIERFLATGEPVGSKFLVGVLSVPVSSATIRNDMAYLSDMGYLDQPHTSAGRIPSDKGYRYYIERLLQNGRSWPEKKWMKVLEENFNAYNSRKKS